MSTSLALPARRQRITQKVRMAGQCCTLYLNVPDPWTDELCLTLTGSDCTSDLIALCEIIARRIRCALQDGTPLETIGPLLAVLTAEPYGPLVEHDRLASGPNLPAFKHRYVAVDYGLHEIRATYGRIEVTLGSASVTGSEPPHRSLYNA